MALDEDAALLPRLRAGEEAAFRELVRRHHTRLVRLAGVFTGGRARAEEAVQDGWVAVVTSLGNYSGEAPLGAWITGIVVNKARTRAARDGRVVSFADLARSEAEGPALEPERFLPDGHWAERFTAWSAPTPEREAGDRQLLARIGDALEALPPAQRAVVLLRDVECQEPAAICQALGITEANMRVLLHRARVRLRDAAAALIEPAAAGKRSIPAKRL
ncbi:MAG: sigma-70 family RNA polymerase sigma factor [Acetobacteraceae bacterium]|nr:sigma-70 family RNA polymerase sigma factor [Acetobacteraceae bacterium]